MQHEAVFRKPKNTLEAITLLASVFILAFPPLLFIGSAGTDIALSSIAILFLVRSAITRDWTWLHATWVRCLFVLWAYMLARSLFAEQPHEALRRSGPFIRYFVFSAALAFWVMKPAAMRRYFLISLAATLAFIMADGLLQWVRGIDLLGREILIDAVGHKRLTGPFGQTKPIMGIVLAWLSFPVCLHLLLQKDGALKPLKSLLPGVFYAISVLCMITLSGERMALLLAGLGWVLVLLFTRISKRFLFMGALAGSVALGLMAVSIPQLFDRQVASTINTFQHWQDSPYGKIMASDMALSTRNPVFGLGTNHFRIACPSLYPGADEAFLKGVCNIHPHNIFFEWLIENGIIGLGLFLMVVLLVLWEARKAWGASPEKALLLGWAIAFALRVWPIGSTTGFFSNWGAPPFWLALGMLLVYSSVTSGKKDDAGTSLPV